MGRHGLSELAMNMSCRRSQHKTTTKYRVTENKQSTCGDARPSSSGASATSVTTIHTSTATISSKNKYAKRGRNRQLRAAQHERRLLAARATPAAYFSWREAAMRAKGRPRRRENERKQPHLKQSSPLSEKRRASPIGRRLKKSQRCFIARHFDLS